MWLIDSLKTVGYIFAVGLFLMVIFWFFGPREEMGEIDWSTSCLADVHTERFAPDTYFKTFVCTSGLAGETRCYHMQTENGVCTKRYDYWYNPEPSSNTASSNSDSSTGLPNSKQSSAKCVTESGVQICDLSYNETSKGAYDTRSISIPGNKVICKNLPYGLNIATSPEVNVISTDPAFCASDYGAVYIDPTVNVAKSYGGIISATTGKYIVPSNYLSCIWTYNGGSGVIPYIDIGNYIGPATSFYNVHAFCQSGANEVTILTPPQI